MRRFGVGDKQRRTASPSMTKGLLVLVIGAGCLGSYAVGQMLGHQVAHPRAGTLVQHGDRKSVESALAPTLPGVSALRPWSVTTSASAALVPASVAQPAITQLRSTSTSSSQPRAVSQPASAQSSAPAAKQHKRDGRATRKATGSGSSDNAPYHRKRASADTVPFGSEGARSATQSERGASAPASSERGNGSEHGHRSGDGSEHGHHH